MEALALARYIENSFGESKGRYEWDHDFRFWLQKTMYFIQGYAVVQEKSPIFSAKIISFPKGPMVEGLHQQLKTTPPSSAPIDCVPYLYVDIIANFLERYSGDRLSTISHTSQPWVDVCLESEITIENISKNFGKSDFEREFIEDVSKAVEEAKGQEKRMKERFKDFSCDSVE